MIGDRLKNVCFSKADATVNNKRIECGITGSLGDSFRRGIGELIRVSHNKRIEIEPAIDGFAVQRTVAF